jgi:chemotaxis protein histidine kinase CheA
MPEDRQKAGKPEIGTIQGLHAIAKGERDLCWRTPLV